MARPKANAPARRYHLSGQSVVEIEGQTFYLGKHDSAEAIARYAVLIGIYQANSCKLPKDISKADIEAKADTILGISSIPQHQEQTPILVRHVTACFREFAQGRYPAGTQEIYRIERLTAEIDANDGDLLAEKYGPVALQRQRERFIEAGLSRGYCNRQVNLIVRMFKHAVSQELVAVETWQRLKAVEPLRAGQTRARETEPILPVAIDVVRKTAVHLSPVVRAMVRVQAATGMRPSEVCRLRPIDIDKSGPDWFYRPKHHKTANRGKFKAVPIIGDAREAIEDYLNRHPESYCFSPKEHVAWLNAQKRAARKTKVQPSQVNRKKANPQKGPREYFDAGSYCGAIKSAAKKAGVPSWHPYQLRHLAATVVRDVLGIEHAGALLGHAQLDMTAHYSRTAEAKALEAARHAPKL